MKNFKFILVMALTLLIGVSSCKKDDVDSVLTTEVYFQSSFPSNSKKTDDVSEPVPVNCDDVLETIAYAYIEILNNSDGISNVYQVDVFVSEGTVDQVITKDPLILPVGDYTITAFYLTDEIGGLPLLAIPTTGSIYSTFVGTPLDQELSIDGISTKSYVDLEVLCIDEITEINFGLSYFDLSVVRTMPICILGNICDEDGMHSEAAFTMTAYEFTGDYSNPRGDMIITKGNYSVVDGDIIVDDALLCTYLPDRTNDDNQEFWIDIEVYDPASPWADETTGLYLVESGWLSEEEIKTKYNSEDIPANGVIPVNWFHFQINHSEDCSEGERFLTNDGCEESFYFCSANSPVSGLFKYVQDEQAMLVHDWTYSTDINFDIAYNSFNDLLYAIKGREVLIFHNDVLKETTDFTNSLIVNNITQAAYANGKLYVGEDNNKIHVVDIDGDGMLNKIYDGSAIQQTVESPVSFNGGDLIVEVKNSVTCLKQIIYGGSIQTWTLKDDGTIDTAVPVVIESGFGLTTGVMVYDGMVYVSKNGVGILPLFGTTDEVLSLPNFTQASDFVYGDMASCSTTVDSMEGDE